MVRESIMSVMSPQVYEYPLCVCVCSGTDVTVLVVM